MTSGNDQAMDTYTSLLRQWTTAAQAHLYVPPGRPELICYGSGENGWGVQTNQKALAAFAVLAATPDDGDEPEALSREACRNLALRMLRYSLQSHIEGDFHCADGQQWGHTWISVLGIERMMHGVDALAESLTEADQALLRRVLLSESDWLLDHYEILGGLYASEGRNKPESNLWNGALLLRTAERYPDCPRADAYREKGLTFLINAVSLPADQADGTFKDGKPVAERYVGANFFPTLALNHHGYLNVGYMVICLSNMAMLHFDYRSRGLCAPEALYHHARELWDVVKRCTFADGRLLRIGGDTRVRYTYCQDYVIPVWHMVQDLWGDAECAAFEEGWLGQIRLEMDAGGDGAFLSARCRELYRQSPLYYTRLESDRAVALSMGLAWRKLIGSHPLDQSAAPPSPIATEAIGQTGEFAYAWHDQAHGAYLHVSAGRIASWVWDAAEKPQGLCLPPGCSDMAEWQHNLSVKLSGIGRITEQRLERHEGQPFTGGFITWGSTIHHTLDQLAEGQPDHAIARSRLVCAALPDGGTMVVLQQAQAMERRVWIQEVKGLHLLIPNDLFNGCSRTYYAAPEPDRGELRRLTLDGAGSSRAEQLLPTGSAWLNIEDQLGVVAVYGTEQLAIHRPGRRQIGLRAKQNNAGLEGSLYADELCGPCSLDQQAYEAGQSIVDAGYVLRTGSDHAATAALADGTVAVHGSLDRMATPGAETMRGMRADGIGVVRGSPDGAEALGGETIRGIQVLGADDRLYAVVANFGQAEANCRLPAVQARDVATGEIWAGDSGDAGLTVTVPPGTARLLVFEE